MALVSIDEFNGSSLPLPEFPRDTPKPKLNYRKFVEKQLKTVAKNVKFHNISGGSMGVRSPLE